MRRKKMITRQDAHHLLPLRKSANETLVDISAINKIYDSLGSCATCRFTDIRTYPDGLPDDIYCEHKRWDYLGDLIFVEPTDFCSKFEVKTDGS
jgi:hypothetical protein